MVENFFQNSTLDVSQGTERPLLYIGLKLIKFWQLLNSLKYTENTLWKF